MESMEAFTTSNTEASNVARRMLQHAKEDEEGIEDDPLDFERIEEILLEESAYDSDDPRSFGGPYYWDLYNHNVSIFKKIRDYVRLFIFYIIRSVGFFLLVMQHFFGLNKSRFQWAVDLAEKEVERREKAALNYLHAHKN